MSEAVVRAPFVPGIRFMRILWRMLGPFAVAANLVAWPLLLGASEEITEQARVAAIFVVGFALLFSVIQEILSPSNKDLRLVAMPDYKAERLATIFRALAITLLGTELAIYLVRANGWGESVASLLALLRTLGLILFGWAAVSRSAPLRALIPEKRSSYGALILWLLIKVVLPLGVLTLVFYVIASALGYAALARWTLRSAVLTGGLILGSAVVYRFLRHRLQYAIGFMRDEQSTDQGEPVPMWIGLERVLTTVLKLGVAIVAFFLLLAIWNTDVAALGMLLAKPVVGSGGLTWGTFVGGIVKVGLVVIAYGLLRDILIFFVFPRTRVEFGARYAILTVTRYAAVVIGVLLGFGALGVDTSTLTVFAGGASVGLAFGMKDIFSNFFSGLIMLLERPVRVGDTIEVGDSKGKIEAIRLRGTRIRTFDGQIVIVPNTEMIGSRLANLSHTFKTARMQVDVGVSYDSDPKEVESILLKIAHDDPRVIADPEPVVRFNNFGNSSLDFSLRVWTHTVDERWAMVSELRGKIFAAFQEANIEIPFPQTDLHIRSDNRQPPPA